MASVRADVERTRLESRREAAAVLEEARSRAQRIQTAAEARATEADREVAELSRRRDEIANELAGLSGVIDALSVPGAVPVAHDVAHGAWNDDHESR